MDARDNEEPGKLRADDMTTQAAWQPKGVRPEARKAATEAARQAGIPVEQWVEAVILRRARGIGESGRAKQTETAPELERLPETATETETPAIGYKGYAPPSSRLQRQLRWLAASSLVVLIFAVAGFGLLWVGENGAPSPNAGSLQTAASHPADLSAASLERIRAAAQAGDREAQFDLAQRYALGEWVPKNDQAAAEWFEKAALHGHPEAQYRLGLLYEQGRAVTQSLIEAFFWFQSAAEQGHREAQFRSAIAYAEGAGVGKDAQQAAAYFRQAAEQGHVAAMYRLADLYEAGAGVAQDTEAARRWRMSAEGAASPQEETEGDVQIVVLDETKPEEALTQGEIETLERLLVGLGFEPGPADGVVTEKTEAAIRLYQAFGNLPTDGKASKALLEELRSVSQSAGRPAD